MHDLMRGAYFAPSLRVAPRAMVVFAAALALTLPAAWLYAWATAPTPSMPNPLYTLGLSVWLALAASRVAALGKVRNPRWMGCAGAALGLAAWYVQWAAWSACLVQPDALLSALTAAYMWLRPDVVLAAPALIVANGPSVPGGAARIVVWLVELGACVIPPALAGAARARKPFCEQTGSWAEEVHVPLQFHFIDDPEGVRRRLERDPGAVLSLLVPHADEAPLFSDVTIHRCRGNESFITICNFGAMRPEDVPLPEIANAAALADEVRHYAQIDEPVVELLRFPVDDVDALVQRWEQAAAARSASASAG
jgi:hypothetical protein